jgi:hypothetical protein
MAHRFVLRSDLSMCAKGITTHLSEATEIIVFSDRAGLRIEDAIKDFENARPSHRTPLSEVMNVDSICGRKPNRFALVSAFERIDVDVHVVDPAIFAAVIVHLPQNSTILREHACYAIRRDRIDPAWHDALVQLMPRITKDDHYVLDAAIKAGCAWFVHAWIDMFRYAPASAVQHTIIHENKELFNALTPYMPRGFLNEHHVCRVAIRCGDTFFVSSLIDFGIRVDYMVLEKAVMSADLEIVLLLMRAYPDAPYHSWIDAARRNGRTDLLRSM